MKKISLTLTIILHLSLGIFAQAPQKINYQAVARDLSGVPLVSTPVNVTFNILAGSSSGTVVYSETHAALTTNQFGLFNTQIGGGVPNAPFVIADFANINWGAGLYYLRITINGDIMPATQLLSVPYALHANTASTGVPGSDGLNCWDTNGNGVQDAAEDINGDLSWDALDCQGDTGLPGLPGTNGIGINWLGTSATAPAAPNLNDAYYNSTNGISYIWDGSTWQTIAQDGTSTAYTAGSGIDITANVVSNVGDLDSTNELITSAILSGTTIEITEDGVMHAIPLGAIANTNDTSATNEIQALSISNDTIFLSNGGFVVLPSAAGDNWGTQVVQTSGTNISGDGTAATPLVVTEVDGSTTNEIQNLSWNNADSNIIDISNGTGIPLSSNTPTINQVLTWNGANWVAQNPGSGADNWGTQVVQTSGTNISGDGTSSNPLIVTEGDPSPTNEIQTLTFIDPNLTLSSGGGTVNLSTLQGTDNQDLSLAGNTLSLTNDATPVDLTPYMDNTDAQTLSYMAATQSLSISNGNTVTLDVTDADADPTNEYNTNFTVNAGNLELTDGGSTLQVPLTSLGDNDWTKGIGTIYNTTDSVGIGLNNPDALLHINRYEGNQLKIGNSNQPTLEWFFDVDQLANMTLFNEGNGTKWPMLYMDVNNKFLGVGTNAPTDNLHVEGTNAMLKLQSTQSTTAANAVISFGNTITGIFDQKGFVGNPGSGDHMQYEAATFHRFTTNGTERMRLTNSGELLIGNFTAFSQLDVNGQITMRSGAVNGYIPVSDANGTMTWTDPTTIATADDGDWIRYFNGTYDYLANDNTHRVRVLDPSSTTANIVSNANTFEIYANGADRGMVVNQRSTTLGDVDGGGAGADIFVDGDVSGDISFRNFGTTAMVVKNTGKVGIGLTNPVGRFDVTTSTDLRASQIQNSFSSANDKYGIYANAGGGGAGNNNGGWFDAFGSATGINTGVGGQALGSAGENRAVYGAATGGTTNWAGYFDMGDVHINNDIRVGTTATGTYSPKVYVHNSTASGKYTVFGALNEYNGNQTMYGYYNRMIATGTGGMAGTWHYMTPSASSSATVYGFRSLILDGGNGARYGSYQYVHADGSGEVNGVYANINHDGTGDVYGLRADVSASLTTGTVRGLWIVGTATSTNYIGGAGLGVGVQTPQNKLDVEGGAVIGASYSGSSTAPTNGLLVEGDFSVGSATINSLYKAQITTSTDQYALYATTSRSVGSNYSLRGSATSTAGFNVGVYGYAYGSGTTNYGLFASTNSGSTTNWALYASGNSYTTAGAWTPSDERLKTGIQQFDGALEKIDQLSVKTYFFDNAKYPTMNFSKKKQYGIMAQNLEQVFPEMVLESEHHILDKKGDLTDETINVKAVNYSQLIPVLVKGMQEQQKQIEELRKEIQDLKNK